MTEQQKIDICLNCQKPQNACGGCVDWRGGKSRQEHDTHKAIRELHSRGLVDREIAAEIGKSVSMVQHIRVKMGLEANGVTTVIDRAFAKELYDQGYSDYEIARKIGCAQRTVNRWRQRNNLPPNAKKRIT